MRENGEKIIIADRRDGVKSYKHFVDSFTLSDTNIDDDAYFAMCVCATKNIASHLVDTSI